MPRENNPVTTTSDAELYNLYVNEKLITYSDLNRWWDMYV